VSRRRRVLPVLRLEIVIQDELEIKAGTLKSTTFSFHFLSYAEGRKLLGFTIPEIPLPQLSSDSSSRLLNSKKGKDQFGSLIREDLWIFFSLLGFLNFKFYTWNFLIFCAWFNFLLKEALRAYRGGREKCGLCKETE